VSTRETVHRVVGSVTEPTSLAARARARRWAEFEGRFPQLDRMRVLDLGGAPHQWRQAAKRPEQVVILNLDVSHHAPEGWLEQVHGDACDPPAALRRERFDLAFSNSVIEHVGGHARRAAFADTVHACADRHWVQTPYRYFPIEPHWLFPGFQFMPLRVRVELSRRWPYGHIRSATPSSALADVCGVELITLTEMAGYFPDSAIWRERVAGLTKSLVAVRS
jgi:hypothetical protein